MVNLCDLPASDEEFAAISLPDAAQNHAPEMTMPEPVEYDLSEAFERLTELGSTGFPPARMNRFVMHCRAALSCL